MSGTLPPGWLRTTLGQVLDYGKTEKVEPDSIDENTWVLELEDIEKDSSKILKRLTYASRQSKSTKNKFSKGDVLYGKLRPYLNKVVIADADGVCTTEIIPLSGEPLVDNRYLFYWLKTAEFSSYVTKVGYGVNMPRLGTKDGQAAPFVLAPREEQARIAQKLDQLLAQVDALKARVDAIPDILKRFRQSVLAAAVSGKLTEEWRAEKKAEEWEGVKLEELILASANGLSKRSGSKGLDTTILRLADFKNASRVFGNERKIKLDDKELEKYSLLDGDILVIRVNGSVELAGRFIKYLERGEVEGFCDHFIRLRLDEGRIISTYLTYVANEGAGRQYLQGSLSTSAGQNTINQGSIKKLFIPLPSVDEQKEIINQVDKYFDYADFVERKVEAAVDKINKLTSSILATAFCGELVSQNPDDQSASELLERIKLEQESKPRKSTASTRTKKVVASNPRRKAKMTKSRFDDDVKNKPYLAGLMKETRKSHSPEELFQMSQLPIDDFYKQLAWEVKNGFIVESGPALEAA